MSQGTGKTMPALVFEFSLARLAVSKLRGYLSPGGHWKPGGPVGIKQVPVPGLPADDWALVRTAYCGICGSDMMELTLSGAADNPLRSFISFPQIMGHEAVGTVETAGPGVSRVKAGDRVAISPWLSCAPRGIRPVCARCAAGDYTHCHNFRRGALPAGMHLGVATGFGGFAPYVAVHESQCFVAPEGVSFEAAVLADPFAVAFHSCLALEPAPEAVVLVYGLGVIGLATVMCLKNIFGVKRVLAVGRHGFQKELALKLGAERVFTSSGAALVEEVAEHTGAELYTPYQGSKWAMDGVDGIIDTIGSAASLEAGMRFLRCRGRLVFTGVSTPARCENTPHYFKELEIIGSNAFAMEHFAGRRAHGFEFYLDFLQAGRLDPASLVTHKFRLERFQDAFDALADKSGSGAVKAVFDFTGN
ncbi:MAG TPA: alcohol dehydrogenase catalytic domain-containing protein [bacterium]|nr:alcohol dehydrogenase catalytic domain-containing protein [bacterium]